MFSCSHFSNFLSDPIRTQSAMPKRGQEATSNEDSSMAKPKPMNSAMAKSRPMNLVMHNPLSARKNPSARFEAIPSNSGNVEKEQGGDPSIRKLMRNPSQDPIAYSQVRREENTQKCRLLEAQPYARMRTFFSLRLSKIIPSAHHVTPGCS